VRKWAGFKLIENSTLQSQATCISINSKTMKYNAIAKHVQLQCAQQIVHNFLKPAVEKQQKAGRWMTSCQHEHCHWPISQIHAVTPKQPQKPFIATASEFGLNCHFLQLFKIRLGRWQWQLEEGGVLSHPRSQAECDQYWWRCRRYPNGAGCSETSQKLTILTNLNSTLRCKYCYGLNWSHVCLEYQNS